MSEPLRAPTSTVALPRVEGLDEPGLAGQLVCVALREYRGDRGTHRAFLDDMVTHGWGGVIVFGGELAAVQDLLAEARDRMDIPPLIAGDFERGLGQQFPESGTQFPPLMAFGAANEPELARAAGRAIARELVAAGFHLNFAPVADLANEADNPIIGTRAAGDDAERAATMVAAMVTGIQGEGVAATVKHVPGHGRTTVDSHEALPVVTTGRTQLQASDWIPFRAGLEAGARVAMSAHVAFPSLEPDGARDRPATFSRAVCHDLLRGEWGFEGLLCSDALTMGAVAGEDPIEAARRGLEAGVDWLLYPPDPKTVVGGITAGLTDGTWDRSRVAEAAHRVLDLKRWTMGRKGLDAAAGPAGAAPLAEAVAAAALSAEPPDPPAGSDWPDRVQWVVVLDGGVTASDIVLVDEIGRNAAQRAIVLDIENEEAKVRARLEEVGRRCGGELVACAVFSPIRAWKNRPGLSPLGRSAVDAACGEASRAILLVFSNPRIVREINAPSQIVWLYGEDPASQRSAVAFLRGARRATGRIPVRLQ